MKWALLLQIVFFNVNGLHAAFSALLFSLLLYKLIANLTTMNYSKALGTLILRIGGAEKNRAEQKKSILISKIFS